MFSEIFTIPVIVIVLCACVFTTYNVMPTLQFFVPRPHEEKLSQSRTIIIVIVTPVFYTYIIILVCVCVCVFLRDGGRYGPFLVAVTCTMIHLRPTA